MSSDRRTQILDLAQSLIQTQGYNAFSFKDLAQGVGIRTASVHYHFPSKAELGAQVMQRYRDQLQDSFAAWDTLPDAPARLRAFVDSYRQTQARGAICLCGSLASDIGTLDAPIREPVQDYLGQSEVWLAACIQGGLDSGTLHSPLPAETLAKGLLASLQGALILSRTQQTHAALDAAAESFFAAVLADAP